MGMKRLKVFILFMFLVILTQPLCSQDKYKLERMPFSTSDHNEFSPYYFQGGLIYCSDKRRSYIVNYTDTSGKGQTPFDIYIVYKSDSVWRKPELFPGPINTISQEGPLWCAANGRQIYFSRNLFSTTRQMNKSTQKNNMGIFISEFITTGWTEPRAFQYNSTKYNVMHPAISEDGKQLVFASDMPGGLGGFDLYICKLGKNGWSQPKNMGKTVNSSKDEAFPFFYKTDRIYYASRGWNSKGGFDIFYTQKINDSWSLPQNMNSPINTADDDFGLIIDETLETGYFSSNRNGSDDIFRFESTLSGFKNCHVQQKNNYCYEFVEEKTSEDDLDNTMLYEWDYGDSAKQRVISGEHCYAVPGEYKVRLNVIDSLTGLVYFKQAEYLIKVEKIEHPYVTCDDVNTVGKSIEFDASETNLKGVTIINYFWDFGDGNIGTSIATTHTYDKEGIYDIRLGIDADSSNNPKKYCVYKTISVVK